MDSISKLVSSLSSIEDFQKTDESGEKVSSVYLGVQKGKLHTYPVLIVTAKGGRVYKGVGKRVRQSFNYSFDFRSPRYQEAERLRRKTMSHLKREGFPVKVGNVQDKFDEELNVYCRIQEIRL